MATDYISREAEIQFFNKWKDDLGKQIDDSVGYPHLRSDYKVCKTQLLDCIHAIKEMPAADVRPVVLCRDCRWWTKQEKSLQGRCELGGFYPTGEWFCANGERSNCGAEMKSNLDTTKGESH